MRLALRAVLLLGAAMLTCTACSAQIDDEAGFGLPSLETDEAVDVADGEPFPYREGTLQVARNGCFHWSSDDEADARWIVWPESAGLDPDDGGAVVYGGRSLGDGAALSGSAALVEFTALPGAADEQSYFGSFGRFCGADRSGVVVLAEFEG